jgi:hypothetical protein
MNKQKADAGYFHNGLPYNQFGHGPRYLVIFQGLVFENKPLSGLMAQFFGGAYKFLEEVYTMYLAS